MAQQKLLQHIEEMRERVSQTAAIEQSLVKDLRDALKELDQRLLQDVHKVAAEHQTRRGGILNELQALAGNIGMFLPAQGGVPAQQIPQQIDYGQQYAPTAGDWRQATTNLNYQDEFERHLNGKSQRH